jgi:hypothetical protein
VKSKTQERVPRYRPGDLGERGTHPADPDGEVFGDTHWPMPQPHEMSGIAIGSFQRHKKHHQEDEQG